VCDHAESSLGARGVDAPGRQRWLRGGRRDHNTVTTIGNAFLVAGDTGPVGSGFVFTNNLVPKGDYGAFGSGQGEGTSCLDFYFPGFEFLANAITGATESAYPTGNFFPPTIDAVGFVDFAGGDYALDATSSYASAGTDGRDLGADFVALEAAVAGVAPATRRSPSPP
jgi:hypothetical protein